MTKTLMAKIKLMEGNHEMREKSIKLMTIFGDVYAPLSKTKIVENVAIVPDWVFANNGLNPCQMIKGFLGFENQLH